MRIIYGDTILHLRRYWATLNSMIEFENYADASAQPGAAASAILGVGQVPRLLSIIIRVAVPGPA